MGQRLRRCPIIFPHSTVQGPVRPSRNARSPFHTEATTFCKLLSGPQLTSWTKEYHPESENWPNTGSPIEDDREPIDEP